MCYRERKANTFVRNGKVEGASGISQLEACDGSVTVGDIQKHKIGRENDTFPGFPYNCIDTFCVGGCWFESVKKVNYITI